MTIADSRTLDALDFASVPIESSARRARSAAAA